MQKIGTLIFGAVEKSLLTIIALLTILATFQELLAIFNARQVKLADLLLLFLYTEVIGMVGAFYKSKKIPITLPLFIAMTALARLIILQGKEMEAITLLYEAGAILILALACLAIRYRPSPQEQNTSLDDGKI
ncbi:phosphate-starvation-inducible PsiE family protein [Alphaproteobacteria bacterium]|nr:phosphate-starvation-inducible PsiE family protein [Alphaproteobacteria bacterium]